MSAIEVASLFGTLDLRDNASAALRAFDSGMANVETRLASFGGKVQSVGISISAITAPLVAFGATGVKVASDFEGALAEISARTGVVGADLKRISDFALQMGADTAFSAQQAADAFLQLLTSGQDTTQAMATLPHVLTAAAASGEDLGRTADLLTDIMAAFGLGVESAGDVVDALARAAGASSADMASLGMGFANVGPIARQFGISVKDTAAILAVFAENGIKGSEAGTQLRSMLNQMTRDTDESRAAWTRLGTSMYDAAGNVRPIADVMQDIRRGLEGMSQEQRIQTIKDLGGAYGQMGLAALTAGDPLRAMLGLMDGSATAADVAAARMNTFAGRLETLRGSIQTLQIKAMTPLMESLKPLLERVTDVVNRITDWVDKNPEATATIIQIVGAVAGLGAGLTTVGTIIKLAAPAIGLFFSPFAMGAAGIAATVAGLGVLAQVLGVDVMGGLQAVGSEIQTFFTVLNEMNGDLGATLRWMLNPDEDGDTVFSVILKGLGMSQEQAEAWGATMGRVVQQAISAFSDLPFYLEYYAKMIWSRAQPALQPILDWFKGSGDNSLSGAIETAKGFLQDVIDVFEGIWIIVQPAVQPILDWFNNDFWNTVQDVTTWVQNYIVVPLQNVWATVQPFLQPIVDFFDGILNTAADAVEMLRRIGGGDPMRTLPGEWAPGQGFVDSNGIQNGSAGWGTNGGSANWNERNGTSGGSHPTLTDTEADYWRIQSGIASLPYYPRAGGGPVWAGQRYLVGEHGPELLTMGGNGHVTPTHQLRGGINWTGNMVFPNVTDSTKAAEFKAMLVEALEEMASAS